MFNYDNLIIDKEEIEAIIKDSLEFIAYLNECIADLKNEDDLFSLMCAYNSLNYFLRSEQAMKGQRQNYIALGRMLTSLKCDNPTLKDFIEDECPHGAFITKQQIEERKKKDEEMALIRKHVEALFKDKCHDDKPCTNLH